MRRVPGWVAVVAAAAIAFVVVPLAGLLARTPWDRAADVVRRPGTLRALALSLVVATIAAIVCVALGVPLGFVLARARFRGRSLIRALVLLPLVAPPVVGGVALLAAFGRRGPFGGLLDAAGISLPFTTTAAVMAAAFVAMPLVVIATESAVRAGGDRLEEAARTLGAGPGLTFRAVTLPAIRGQVVAGGVLAWARALGEFGATITFAGNIRGTTQTLPLAVYETLQTDPGGAIAMSLILIAVAAALLASLRGTVFTR